MMSPKEIYARRRAIEETIASIKLDHARRLLRRKDEDATYQRELSQRQDMLRNLQTECEPHKNRIVTSNETISDAVTEECPECGWGVVRKLVARA